MPHTRADTNSEKLPVRRGLEMERNRRVPPAWESNVREDAEGREQHGINNLCTPSGNEGPHDPSLRPVFDVPFGRYMY